MARAIISQGSRVALCSFHLSTGLRRSNQRAYQPPEGLTLRQVVGRLV
jgi:hypothetical protein